MRNSLILFMVYIFFICIHFYLIFSIKYDIDLRILQDFFMIAGQSSVKLKLGAVDNLQEKIELQINEKKSLNHIELFKQFFKKNNDTFNYLFDQLVKV